MVEHRIRVVLLSIAFLAFPHTHAQDSTFHHAYAGRTAELAEGHLIVRGAEPGQVDTVFSDYDELFHLSEDHDQYSVQQLEELRRSDPEAHAAILARGRTYEAYAHHVIVSVVGPILSYNSTWYAEGGAHPSYGTLLLSHNMVTGRSANLLELFAEEEVFAALKADTFLLQYLQVKDPPDLDAFVAQLWSDCDYRFDDLLGGFAIDHVAGDTVAVRLGLTHGCELMRGNYHEIMLHLPLPETMAGEFTKAQAMGLLMRQRERTLGSKNE